MTAKRIDGKKIAAEKKRAIRESVRKLGIVPGLAVILVGDDPASRSYIKGKSRDCRQAGFHSDFIHFPVTVSEQEVLDKIHELNERDDIHGILVQRPLPDHISGQKVVRAIRPSKDVDGSHPVNRGRLFAGQETFTPCTSAAIMEVLKAVHVPVAGKHVVIVGRSLIVGKPASLLFLNLDATVTICHSKTTSLSDYTKQGDILVVATGHAGLIGAEDIKPGAVVIDVGMNRNKDGKWVGDVAFSEASKKAGFITPVPGGVGPVTRAMLLANTLKAAEKLIKDNDPI
ncbi:tetrahydrofolate dehydrogenase/cyclohydrolase catalytic domain-containing protein [Sporolactobacillus sp. Y61]|jgi:methylenetetrahydrofolate dehydrogenase (NADP+)/methenyltetrahydrofolate cyclohydrolase|uniref:Bifunctional protein FolD n=1 Tax=Sporolactobacillus sp. Y61 TaxID=3160863 RepID=A0AAU8IDY0_9BACL|nr:tetrahydrofolate dehydrogenase/cyclohydrolase catalytic domain-containing protein [Sporolactobacillus sp. THM19-2]RYL87849.1 bifunctional 5,10-methylene-tetrahydrofolate dehydrogenase/5,10-methylene-tetrahydrofolate cyclohydrolase [Sporolactobacillus sp. THM19-2]